MRNKYMRRGVLFLLAGIGLNLVGWVTQQQDLSVYKWAMTIGTLLFGFGFLLVLYSLIRKVERQSILEERAIEHEKVEHHNSNTVVR
ncbi:MAG TPA: signal peptidase [Sphingobacteriaceae bacterium]|nr:signal peptidase [Sphingobacteriaceae bacterium]